MNNSIKITLVITTYNRPKALNVVLKSVLHQTELPDEVIIADDGSGDETRSLINSYSSQFPVPLIHSWQEDTGFRLSTSRNKAIAMAVGEYIVLIDGDMLLDPNYISDHRKSIRKGYMYICSRVFLSEEMTQQIEHSENIHIPFWSKGIDKNKLNQIRLMPMLYCAPLIKNYQEAKGYMAFWKSDGIAVNGFDELYEGWGREDSDFMMRMINVGVIVKKMKGRCISYHLYHKEADRSNVTTNHLLLEQVMINKLTSCKNGINKYL